MSQTEPAAVAPSPSPEAAPETDAPDVVVAPDEPTVEPAPAAVPAGEPAAVETPVPDAPDDTVPEAAAERAPVAEPAAPEADGAPERPASDPSTHVHSSSSQSANRAPAESRAGGRKPGRPGRSGGKKAYDSADFANLPVPDELLKFNALLAAEKSALNAEKKEKKAADELGRRIAEAEADKDAAAKRLRDLNGSPKATGKQKDEADEAYKAAIARVKAIKAGEDPDAGTDSAADAETDESPSDTTDADTTDADTTDGDAADATDSAPTDAESADEAAAADESNQPVAEAEAPAVEPEPEAAEPEPAAEPVPAEPVPAED